MKIARDFSILGLRGSSEKLDLGYSNPYSSTNVGREIVGFALVTKVKPATGRDRTSIGHLTQKGGNALTRPVTPCGCILAARAIETPFVDQGGHCVRPMATGLG